MGNDVFANGRELSCKAGSGKSICAFPDVCFTPPQTPATPPGVPIPYPNTGMASDTSKGSRDVKITKKEVMLKNKSMFKKSVGDQAGCAPKKGVVTSQTGGKVYFNSWSMDVKIEGENAVRHLDLTTHNHGSVPGNTPTWPFIDQMAAGGFKDDDPCKEDIIKEQEACKNFQPYGDEDPCKNFKFDGSKSSMPDTDALNFAQGSRTSKDKLTAKSDSYHFGGGKNVNPAGQNSSTEPSNAEDCLTARACQLVPYKPNNTKKAGRRQARCCDAQTAHHLVEASSFFEKGRGAGYKNEGEARVSPSADHAANVLAIAAQSDKKREQYKEGKAPSVCVWGPNQNTGTHGCIHTMQGNMNDNSPLKGKSSVLKKNGDWVELDTIPYGEARDNGVAAAKKINPKANCADDCMKAQLDAYHKDKLGIQDDDAIKCVAAGKVSNEAKKETTKTLKKVNFGKTKF